MANFQKKQEEDDEDVSHYCPCCGNPYEADSFSLCCSITELSELGEGFPLQYHLVRWVCIAFIVALLVSGVYCLHANYEEKRISEWDQTLDGNMIMESSLANFGRDGTPSVVQPWLHVLCMWLFLALHQYLTQRHRSMCRELDRQMITPSDYTCAVTGLPRPLDLRQFTEYIESLTSPCKVSKVNLAYDVDQYVRTNAIYGGLKIARKKVEKKQEQLAPANACCACLKATHTIEDFDMQLVVTDKQLQALKADQKNKFIGIAFVTFQQDESKGYAVAKEIASKYARKKLKGMKALFCRCLIKSNLSDSLIYNGTPIRIRRAPEPDDIMWENLAVTKAQKRRNRIITYIATGAVLLACAGIIYASGLSKKAIKDWKRGNSNPSAGQNLAFSLVAFLPSILVIFINTVLGIVVRKFSLMERHKTFTDYDSSVLKKLTVAMFLNTAIVAIAIHWGEWYEPGGLVQEVYNILIANAIVPPIMTLCGPRVIVKKVRQLLEVRKGERSMLSQAEAHVLFEGLQLDMAQRCAVFMKTYMLTLFYAPILPLAYVISTVALTLQYWADKYMLLKQNSRPDLLSHELDETMLGFLSLGTILYGATNMLFFLDFSDNAIAPGVVGIVTTVFYNFFPLRRLIKFLRSPTLISTNAPVSQGMSESEKPYEEAMVDFVDVSLTQDYDRCNPVTAEDGKQLWRDAVRKKHPNICGNTESDLFPGAEPDASERGGAVQLAARSLIKKNLGAVGPKRTKHGLPISPRPL